MFHLIFQMQVLLLLYLLLFNFNSVHAGRFSFGKGRRSCTGRQLSIPMDSVRESSWRETLLNAFWKEVYLQVELHPGVYVVERRLTSL